MSWKQVGETLLKGGVVGSTMLVPGVSGGSMALILGIYDRLIRAISTFTKDIKQNAWFLGVFLIGSLIGMLLFARSILYLIDIFPKPSLYFFIGAVLGGVPVIFKKAEIKKIDFRIVLYPLLGVIIVFGIDLLPREMFSFGGMDSWFSWCMLAIAGIIISVALVLPGISVSYMLLVLGIYDVTMTSLSTMNMLFLVPLGLSVLCGVILTTHILESAMIKYPQGTFLVILGFVLTSLKEVFPGIPTGLELVTCGFTMIMGYLIIHWMGKFSSATSAT